MSDFFKGWRRKTSLILLTMALLLTSAWMRSFRIHDSFYAGNGQTGYYVGSFKGGLSFERWTNSAWWDREYEFQWTHAEDISQWPSEEIEKVLSPWANLDVEWRWQMAGASLGVGTSRVRDVVTRHDILRVPYSLLVLPLTLLAAYLLLTKARSTKPPISNPDATKTGG